MSEKELFVFACHQDLVVAYVIATFIHPVRAVHKSYRIIADLNSHQSPEGLWNKIPGPTPSQLVGVGVQECAFVSSFLLLLQGPTLRTTDVNH